MLSLIVSAPPTHAVASAPDWLARGISAASILLTIVLFVIGQRGKAWRGRKESLPSITPLLASSASQLKPFSRIQRTLTSSGASPTPPRWTSFKKPATPSQTVRCELTSTAYSNASPPPEGTPTSPPSRARILLR